MAIVSSSRTVYVIPIALSVLYSVLFCTPTNTCPPLGTLIRSGRTSNGRIPVFLCRYATHSAYRQESMSSLAVRTAKSNRCNYRYTLYLGRTTARGAGRLGWEVVDPATQHRLSRLAARPTPLAIIYGRKETSRGFWKNFRRYRWGCPFGKRRRFGRAATLCRS
jgi:hypothetical protein